MDDLLVILGFEEKDFQDILRIIYKDILELKKTISDKFTCDYLDITLKVINNKIETVLYNKTDSFKFKVIRFRHASSAISNKVKSAVILTETLRTAHACSKLNYFIDKIVELKNMLLSNGYSEDLVIAGIIKCI